MRGGGASVSEQQKKLEEDCAQFVATKLVHLLQEEGEMMRPLPIEPPRDNSLLSEAAKKHDNRDFVKKVQNPEKEDPRSTVVETLVPTLIKLDQDGVPISAHEEVWTEKKIEVETIDWVKWRGTAAPAAMITHAKNMAASSIWVVNQGLGAISVAVVRKGTKILTQASDVLEVGALKVPVNFS